MLQNCNYYSNDVTVITLPPSSHLSNVLLTGLAVCAAVKRKLSQSR